MNIRRFLSLRICGDHSQMQPVYGLTKGLSNKAITKLVHQVLDTRPLRGEYLPEELRERYQLARC